MSHVSSTTMGHAMSRMSSEGARRGRLTTDEYWTRSLNSKQPLLAPAHRRMALVPRRRHLVALGGAQHAAIAEMRPDHLHRKWHSPARETDAERQRRHRRYA